MYTMSMLKLGPLILIVNLFFSISAIAESKYAEKTKDIIRGELRKFIFSEKMEVFQIPLFWMQMKIWLRLVTKKIF